MKNLVKSQQSLEKTTLINSLKQSIALAFERTGTPPVNIDNMSKDIATEFEGIKDDVVSMAIRNGSLGHYGRTYRLSTQEICIWIREYKKETGRVKLNMNVK